MAKITPVLWKIRTNKKGESPIYLRYEAANRRLYSSVSISVKPKLWNKKGQKVSTKDPHHVKKNKLIKQKVHAAENAVYTLMLEEQSVTPESIKEALRPAKPSDWDLIAYGQRHAALLRTRGQISTSNRYESVMRKLAKFAGETLTFDQVTAQLMKEWETHMIEKLGNKQSTRASNFRAVRCMINLAKEEGLFPNDINPFKLISTQEPSGEKRKLSSNEIAAIRDLAIEERTPVWHARNYWLFSMYVGGMRFRDIATLQWKSIRDGRLSYKMSKTGRGKNVDIPPVAQAVLDFYIKDKSDVSQLVFPMLKGYDLSTPEKLHRSASSQNAYVNRLLKNVSEEAGIGIKLSFHMSRHSFANSALKDGWSVRKIQAALGHKDIATTERYLGELDAEFTGNEMGKLFSTFSG